MASEREKLRGFIHTSASVSAGIDTSLTVIEKHAKAREMLGHDRESAALHECARELREKFAKVQREIEGYEAQIRSLPAEEACS